MLNCSLAPWGVDVAVGAVEVGVPAVAVTVLVGAVVVVADALTSGNSPLPHPELGSIMKVNTTIVRMGMKRANSARVRPSGSTPRGVRVFGAVGRLIGPST